MLAVSVFVEDNFPRYGDDVSFIIQASDCVELKFYHRVRVQDDFVRSGSDLPYIQQVRKSSAIETKSLLNFHRNC